jgi:hypothetical protein
MEKSAIHFFSNISVVETCYHNFYVTLIKLNNYSVNKIHIF